MPSPVICMSLCHNSALLLCKFTALLYTSTFCHNWKTFLELELCAKQMASGTSIRYVRLLCGETAPPNCWHSYFSICHLYVLVITIFQAIPTVPIASPLQSLDSGQKHTVTGTLLCPKENDCFVFLTIQIWRLFYKQDLNDPEGKQMTSFCLLFSIGPKKTAVTVRNSIHVLWY